MSRSTLWLYLAQGLGTGRARWMPGTFGTLPAIPLYLWMQAWPLWLYGLVLLVMAVWGCWLCEEAAKQLAVHDDPSIVWDEIVGYLLTMLWVPFSWSNLLLGFLLFRLFDIVKPWPIRTVDKNMPGGMGIMLDDLLAALYAGAILAFLQ